MHTLRLHKQCDLRQPFIITGSTVDDVLQNVRNWLRGNPQAAHGLAVGPLRDGTYHVLESTTGNPLDTSSWALILFFDDIILESENSTYKIACDAFVALCSEQLRK